MNKHSVLVWGSISWPDMSKLVLQSKKRTLMSPHVLAGAPEKRGKCDTPPPSVHKGHKIRRFRKGVDSGDNLFYLWYLFLCWDKEFLVG